MSSALQHATLTFITIFSSGSTSSIASGSNAISGVQDPTGANYGGSGTQPGYELMQFSLQSGTTALAAAPAANSGYQIFFRRPVDGTTTGTPTTWENDPGRSTNPSQVLKASRAADTTSTTQNLTFEPIEIPAVPFEVILLNNGTGVALPAGWSLIGVPMTDKVA